MSRTPSPPPTTVDLQSRKPDPDSLPHERDQSPGSQSPAAGQDSDATAVKGFQDAQKGRPDTSAAPLLQQPSPDDRQAEARGDASAPRQSSEP